MTAHLARMRLNLSADRHNPSQDRCRSARRTSAIHPVRGSDSFQPGGLDENSQNISSTCDGRQQHRRGGDGGGSSAWRSTSLRAAPLRPPLPRPSSLRASAPLERPPVSRQSSPLLDGVAAPPQGPRLPLIEFSEILAWTAGGRPEALKEASPVVRYRPSLPQ